MASKNNNVTFYPCSPRELSTVSLRSSSTTSNNSTTSSTRRSSSNAGRRLSHDELQDRAVTILTTLASTTGDYSSLSALVSNSVHVQHEDDDPTTQLSAFLDTWETKMNRCPNYKLAVQEALVDETQRKVWVRSQVTGVPRLDARGLVKETVDMMTFDDNGVLVSSLNSFRIQRIDD